MSKYRTLLITALFVLPALSARAEIEHTPKRKPAIFEKQAHPFAFDQQKWNEMRRSLEEGRKPGEKVVISTVTSPELHLPPPPPGAVVELPYETRLSINGRKLIGVDLKAVNYDVAKDGRSNRFDFNMKQELQVKIKGQVGRKIMVNVDFDDTVPDKRDISVVYKGEPDEVVQEASFGDITLSLPNTEFVGYSRQAFGIKLDTKYKRLRTIVIASQTKGIPETKRFFGTAKLERPDNILDTSYTPKRYYKLTFGTDTIKPNTEEIRIDRRDLTKIQNSLFIYYSSGTLLTPTASGYFDLLLPGNDYTIDYVKGIITFRNTAQDNAIIAVNYQRNDGTWLNTGLTTKSTFYNFKTLKDDINTPGITQELKNYYSLGRPQIMRDNGRGNFVLKIVKNSAALEEPPDINGKVVPKYPSTMNVEFESGIFWLTDSTGNPYMPFPDSVYVRTPQTAGYRFFTEYRYATKTFQLRAGIIPQSEQVVLDSVLLKRDIDYFFDYDAGILTFIKEDKVSETSILDVTYEYATFGGLGGQAGESLFGLRSELSLTNNVFIGGSWIRNFPPIPQGLPDIRSVPQDLLVWEMDGRIAGMPLAVPLVGTLNLGFGGEYAESVRNLNINGRARIENMENIKQEDGPSLFKDSWKNGWTPTPYFAYGNDKDKNPDRTKSSIFWDNSDLLMTDVYGKTTALNEKISVMNINYNFSGATEAAIMQNLSQSGLDFSRKLYLEMRIKYVSGTATNSQLKIELGKFNEDVDHSGVFKREDKRAPGILSAGEDIGWAFVNPDNSTAQIGAANGVIDSMDADANGLFDTADQVVEGTNGTFMIDLQTEVINQATTDNNGWIYIKKPITIANPQEWNYVKQIRMTIKAPGETGNIQIANLSIVGNKWDNLNPGVVDVSAVNNFDDPDYRKNAFVDFPNGPTKLEDNDYTAIYGPQDIQKDTTKREQSLQIKFTGAYSTAAFAGARLVYTRAFDLTSHRKIRFYVFPSGIIGNQFILRAGHDDNNYFEYITTVTWTDAWRMIEIEQTSDSESGLAARWLNSPQNVPPGATSKVGNPSLTNITNFKVLLSTFPASSGKVWVNEIYASDSIERKGYANKVFGDLALPGWFAAGGTARWMDSNFETFVQSIKGQESRDESAYLNLTRLSFSWLNSPQNFSASRSHTRTPFLDRSGDLVSFLNQDETNRTNLSYNTGLSFPLWPAVPQINGGYTISVSSISNNPQKIFRQDTTENYNGTLNWGLNQFRPTGIDLFDSIIPTNLNINTSEIITTVEPWETKDIKISSANPITRELSRTGTIRLPWELWHIISFSPSYTETRITEDKYLSLFNRGSFTPDLTYDKSRSQNAGASAAIRLARWFSPSVNYNIQTNETYNFAVLDKEKVSKLKTVNRTGSGDVSMSLGAADMAPSFTPTRSLNLTGGYNIADGDTYENIVSTRPTFGEPGKLEKFWIRELLDEDKMTRLYQQDSVRLTTRWNVFEGIPFPSRLEPIKRINTTANFNESKAFNNTTGTKTQTRVSAWPDLLLTLPDIEQFFGAGRYITDSRVDYKIYSKRDISERYTDKWEPQSEVNNINENVNTNFNLLRNYSVNFTYGTSLNKTFDYLQKKVSSLSKSLDYSVQVGLEFFKIKFTPRYGFRSDLAWAGDPATDQSVREKPTQDLVTKTYSVGFYSDTSFPGGLPIPLINKRLNLTNRFIFNANYTFTERDTEKGDVSKNKTDQQTATINADYEISGNLRMGVSAGYDRFVNRGVQDRGEDYTSYSASGQLTIIF